MKRSEAIDVLFHHEAWPELVAMEREIMEDNLMNVISVSLDDPNYALKVAYFNGFSRAIKDLWYKRDLLRAQYKQKKGKKDANNETQK